MSTTTAAEDTGHARFVYRPRVSLTAQAALLAEWSRCRWVWNECVAKSKQVHTLNTQLSRDADKPTCGPTQLDRMLGEARAATSWLRSGASVPQKQIIRDFGKARAKALKDIRKRLPIRRRAGMPRFKKKHDNRPTLNYTRYGFRIKNRRLHLAGGITLTVVWSRELPAEPSSVRVYQDSIGHWYASFVVPAQTISLPATGQAIGVDWGVKELATTTSDHHDLPHPEYGKKAAQGLARYQRMMARRRPPRGYQHAQRQAAKAHKKVARQRQDTARKWAKQVVTDFDQVAVEDFQPKFLAKSTMARKAADAAISVAKRELITMARKHGRDLRLVDPKHTTMDCAHCGARTKHRLPLSERTYTCTACGHQSPRDKNSAHVILIRAGFVPAGADRGRPGHSPSDRAA